MPNGIRGGALSAIWGDDFYWSNGEPVAYSNFEQTTHYTTRRVPLIKKPTPTERLFVGGVLDGETKYMGNYREWSVLAAIPTPAYTIQATDLGAYSNTVPYQNISTQSYKLRTYTNPEGESFSVMVLDTLRGYEVLQMLASREYRNNPLKAKNKA